MEISVVLPAYKEAENLEKIIPEIHKVLAEKEYEILVIDAMYPVDNTEQVCEKRGATYVPRMGGNNYGDAIRTGFQTASGKYLVIMDADGSHDPKEILQFYEQMENSGYDLVIGSRYCKGGRTDNPFVLIAMSWALNVAYRTLFGLKVKDVSDSYRMYRNEQIKCLDLECDNFDIVEEILIKLAMSKKDYHIKEVPISFNKRQAGESKRNLWKFIISYIRTMKRLLKIKREIILKQNTMNSRNKKNGYKCNKGVV